MLDKVTVVVKAGNGGDGAVSFRREKFIPFGGPDGGDGGDGGAVIIMADRAVSNLREFRRGRVYRAADGRHGQGRKKHGKKGNDVVLRVPVGTVVSDTGTHGDSLVADLEQPGQAVVVASGGRGGSGNVHFAASTNQAPRIAQKGERGEEQAITLELRLIADVGIIGYPNVGKSTLLAAASAAKPEVAGYPFTTREPVLGVVEVGQRSFVLAEIPGLIDGAHLGRGLGHDFLRHVARTKILIHLVDGSSGSPVEDMVAVNTELGLFDAALASKPQLVVVNKIDLPEVRSRLAEMEDAFGQAGAPVLFVSAAEGEGVAELMTQAMMLLERLAAELDVAKPRPKVVFRPQPRHVDVSVQREGDTFVVVAPQLERIVARVDLANAEVRHQLQTQLERLGVSRALQKAGVNPGDKVRCGGFEWEW